MRASPSGVPHPSSTPQLAGVPLDRAGTSAVWGTPPDSYWAPLMTRCRSLHWRALSLSLWGWWLGCVAPFGCGSIVRARPRDNGYAFLGRRALMLGSCGNLNRVPIRVPKRVVSQWGSGWISAPPSGAILPGSARGAYKFVEGTFHCPKKILWLLPLTTLDGGASLGYMGIPSVERFVAMCLPSGACRYSSGLTGSAYRACGEVASALHAIALLQVHKGQSPERPARGWSRPGGFRQHKSRQRRSNTSCARGNLLLPLRLQPLSLLFAAGALLRLPPLPRSSRSLPPGSVKEPVAGRMPSPFRPPPNLAASTNARGPEMGDPEMEETARREMVTAPLPPPEEGRVESLV